MALEAATGRVIWRHDLKADFGAPEPAYGFAASPLVVGSRLVIQAGGTTHNLAAFDKVTGKLLWAVNHSKNTGYASPVLATLLGRSQIVVHAGDSVYGASPEDGALLWIHPLGAPIESDRPPLVLPGDRVVLSRWEDSRLLQIEAGETGFKASEVWKSTRLRGSYSPTILHEGHLYAMGGPHLLCVDPATGNIVWREKVYPGSMILVDGQLLHLGEQSGELRVAPAAPEDRGVQRRGHLLDHAELRGRPGADAQRGRDRGAGAQMSAAGRRIRPSLLASALALLAIDGAGAWGADWPRWLGPSQNGSTSADGLLSPPTLRLKKAWRHSIGGGRGGVVVAVGRLFALITDGETQSALALRAEDGKELWQVPLVENGRVVLQPGGPEDHRLVALDARTGDLVWSAKGAERGNYSSPVATELSGVRQAVVHQVTAAAPQSSGLAGFRMEDGALLWSGTFEANVSTETPLVLPQDRVLLVTWNDAKLARIKRAGERMEMETLWAKPVLRSRISPPVHLEGHTYGFNGDDLTCLRVETGEVVWKQRTYAGSLILVGDTLVILSANAGLVRVVGATPFGYREKAQIGVLNRGAQTEAPPSFASSRIFVRNDEEIAAVTIEP